MTDVTKLTTEVVEPIANVETGLNPYFDSETQKVMSITKISFNGFDISKEVVEDPNHPEAPRILDEQKWAEFQGKEICSDADCQEIPEIEEVTYGTSEVNGEPLKAYGVVRFDSDYDNPFRTKWFRSLEEAETVLAQSKADFQAYLEWNKKRAEIVTQIEELNKARKEVGLKEIEIGRKTFTLWGKNKNYTDENLDFAKKEVDFKMDFDSLNKRWVALGKSELTLDSDGEFKLGGSYRKLTQDEIDYFDQQVSQLEEEVAAEAEAQRVEQERLAKLEEQKKEILPVLEEISSTRVGYGLSEIEFHDECCYVGGNRYSYDEPGVVEKLQDENKNLAKLQKLNERLEKIDEDYFVYHENGEVSRGSVYWDFLDISELQKEVQKLEKEHEDKNSPFNSAFAEALAGLRL